MSSKTCGPHVESYKALDSIPLIKEISNHPVHIINVNGELNPSAFIPFCRVGDHVLGETIRNFSQPVCNVFKPKVFEGQLCYSINWDLLDPQPMIGSGPSNGLTLLLDYNEERSIGTIYNTGATGMKKNYYRRTE